MGSPRIIFKGGSIMSKKYEKNDVNENIVNDIETEVITEVTDEAEAPVEVEVIEDKYLYFTVRYRIVGEELIREMHIRDFVTVYLHEDVR